ncbi:Serine/threonine-protein kinase RIO1 [Erysiphe neolycopersici]|uniref:Serine/threonine-protein kinase RIO1 n=1 Tax=Erysiphe neolycopersici TaxID=212602 RepID=A0A420HKM6_9PEZI|nr:Serine/threonine-protein kinase RIO1 [Erysiphe neolycopersici]
MGQDSLSQSAADDTIISHLNVMPLSCDVSADSQKTTGALTYHPIHVEENRVDFVKENEYEDDEDDEDEEYDDDNEDEDESKGSGFFNAGIQNGKDGNLVNNCNQTRKLIPPTYTTRTNIQRPTMNNKLSIDDQITSLAKHAAKIQLHNIGERIKTNGKDKSDRATSEQVLDPQTRMLLLQIINKGIVSEINGCLSTGKEANVYGAIYIPEFQDSQEPKVIHRAIKVYKTSILVFKDRDRYVTGEHRFKTGYNKRNHRAMVKLWSEKEFRNLKRLFLAKIPCPEPVYLRSHVLVMGFLGDKDGWPAPRLRDVELQGDNIDEQWKSLYLQAFGLMRQMYQTCKLVHADLSDYNILYHQNRLFIIDVSQSVEHDHPRSLEFLRLDIKNVTDFFRRRNVNVLSEQSLFNFILSSNQPVQDPALKDALDKLFSQRPIASEDKKNFAEQEIDIEVFRQQYIPQTLEQVYNVELDTEKVGRGEKHDLIYHNLLADKAPTISKSESDSENDMSENSSDGGVTLTDNEDLFKKGLPRGKRFEDKDAKREHKRAVKEDKREKRKQKMPKYIKKKLVSSSAKHK